MIQATKAALADAGLGVGDIDGITSVGTEPLLDAWLLGIEPLNWWASGMMAPAFSYSATQAIAAVASGFCHTALALRVIGQQPSSSALVKGAGANHPMTSMLHRAAGDRQFIVPFGAGSPVQWAGMFTQRYMQQYGATEEDFGRHVITQRYHASMNDDAIFREEMTLDDYLDARYVSKPLRILDCDYPVDSGSAVIFTTEERARDLDQPVVLVESYALNAIRDLHFEVMSDMVHTAPVQTAKKLWEGTDLTPADVDTAQLYDGFSIIVFQWLEALGFCGEGEAGAFVARGQHQARRLPPGEHRRRRVQRRPSPRRQLLHRVHPPAARAERRASGRRRRGRGVDERGRPLRRRRHPHQGLSVVAPHFDARR